jgi:CheY-like chemotaxis protein
MIADYQPEDTTILIVDDKPANRELLGERLSR